VRLAKADLRMRHLDMPHPDADRSTVNQKEQPSLSLVVALFCVRTASLPCLPSSSVACDLFPPLLVLPHPPGLIVGSRIFVLVNDRLGTLRGWLLRVSILPYGVLSRVPAATRAWGRLVVLARHLGFFLALLCLLWLLLDRFAFALCVFLG